MKKKAIAILTLATFILAIATSCESTRHTCPAYRGSVVENNQ